MSKSKRFHAYNLFRRMQKENKTREWFVNQCMLDLDVTRANAGVYYYNAKKQWEDELDRTDEHTESFRDYADRMKSEAEKERAKREAAEAKAKAEKIRQDYENFRRTQDAFNERAYEKARQQTFEDAVRAAFTSVSGLPADVCRVLGVVATATKEEVTSAYKKLAVQHHPDRPGGSLEKMQQINVARDKAMKYFN